MKHEIRNKLRSRAGETIGETLVALLIAALALTMLAGSMAATSKVVERGKETVNKYYDSMENAINLKNKNSAKMTLTEAENSTTNSIQFWMVSWDYAVLGDTKVVIYSDSE